MDKENKDLLLKYLCMALPYGVHLFTNSKHHIRLLTISNDTDYDEQYWINGLYDIDEVKPYLRPMSSMTEEEKEEWADLFNKPLIELDKYFDKDAEEIAPQMFAMSHTSSINWLLEHHFDFMGLIPKGIAIEVTESNNPYESNM